MQKRTLPRRALAGAGWAHPYATGPFDPYLYADGGDGGDSGSDSGDSGDDGGDDSGDDDAGGSGDDDTGGNDGAGKDDKQAKPKAPAKKDDDEDPAAKIARLEKDLKAANAEAGKARTNAKKQAADEARTQIVQELGKALGLIKDDKDTPPDPAALMAQVEKATAAHKETAIELAVFRGASKHGADPEALTDSRTFLKSIADLDPTDGEFAKKVGAAIKKAVDDNPKLKAASQAPARTSGDFGGSSEKPKNNNTVEAQREAYRKGRR